MNPYLQNPKFHFLSQNILWRRLTFRIPIFLFLDFQYFEKNKAHQRESHHQNFFLKKFFLIKIFLLRFYAKNCRILKKVNLDKNFLSEVLFCLESCSPPLSLRFLLNLNTGTSLLNSAINQSSTTENLWKKWTITFDNSSKINNFSINFTWNFRQYIKIQDIAEMQCGIFF